MGDGRQFDSHLSVILLGVTYRLDSSRLWLKKIFTKTNKSFKGPLQSFLLHRRWGEAVCVGGGGGRICSAFSVKLQPSTRSRGLGFIFPLHVKSHLDAGTNAGRRTNLNILRSFDGQFMLQPIRAAFGEGWRPPWTNIETCCELTEALRHRAGPREKPIPFYLVLNAHVEDLNILQTNIKPVTI